MTQLEQFEAMLSGKTEYTLSKGSTDRGGQTVKDAAYIVTINPTDRSRGYNGFFSEWFFTEDGKFLDVAHWE